VKNPGSVEELPQPPVRIAEPLSTSAKGILVSVNPRAGAHSAVERVQAVRKALRARGFSVQITTDLAELGDKSTRWHQSGALRAVVAAGGDGTASAVRNAVPASVPLLPLPFGTECLLARHIGQSVVPEEVCDVISNGYVVPLDIGRVDTRLFLLMMSVGIDAEVIYRLQSRRTGHITHASYVKPTLEALRNYKYPELRVYCSDYEVETGPVCCRWLLGFNLPCYARGLRFAPQALGTDGLLDLCMFGRGSTWSLLRYLWQVARRRHLNLPEVQILQRQSFRVEAAGNVAVAVQVDGDRAGRLPIEVEIIPNGLNLLVSACGANRLGVTLPNN
jgi:diacylglycerol kinase family enzyme